MRIANLAQTFEVTVRRHQDTGRTGDGFYETGGDGVSAVEVAEPLQVVRQFGAGRRLSPRMAVLRLPRVAHVNDAGHDGRKGVAVAH